MLINVMLLQNIWEILMDIHCSWDEDQKRSYVEDSLEMYKQGVYDLPSLAIMLLNVPGLDVAQLLQRSIPFNERSQEVERMRKVGTLPEQGIRRLETFYIGSAVQV